MRLFLFAMVTTFLLSGCSAGKKISHQKYFPSAWHNVHFGMAKADFLKAHPNAKMEQDDGFRTVYIETLDSEELEAAVYYFDNDETELFYEIILVYKSEELRDDASKTLLGKPNYENGSAWMNSSKEGFRIHAWTFKTKLIIVGKIDGTEWAEDQSH